MVRDLQHFAVSVPANTLQSAPQVTSLAMAARTVRGIRFRIPPGPAGNLGFQLASGGQQVLPQPSGAFIVGDDEVIEWTLDGQPSSGAWQLRAYNTGVYAHTLYITFYLDLPQHAAAGAVLTSPLDLGG